MREYPLAKTAAGQKVLEGADVIKSILAPGVDPTQFIAALILEANALRMTMDEGQLNDPRTIASFVRSAFNAAAVGLIVGPSLGHAYLIPYTLHRGQDGEHVAINFIPGYRGLLELGFASNFLVQCDPEVVLANEDVERWHDSKPRIKHHIPIPRGQDPDRTNVVGAYCTYQTRAGGEGLVYIERNEIDKVDTKRNVWKSNYLAMVLKTPIRRAAKRWRITRQMAYAIDLDERAEREEQQPSLVPEDKAAEETIDLDGLEE